MFSKHAVLFGVISTVRASATQDESFTADLRGCQSFASKFDNTCTSTTTQLTMANVPTSQVTCRNQESCPTTDGFTGDASSCMWKRKLCVTCYTSKLRGNPVKIRVQSNGLPNHCFTVPSTVSVSATDIEYEVNWQTPIVAGTTESSATTQDDLDSLICNIMRSKDDNIPDAVGYSRTSGALNTVWGIAVSGVQIFNGISAEGVDPFYPPKTWNGANTATPEKVDTCQAHPQRSGMFHYHIASACIADKEKYQSAERNRDDIVDTVTTAYAKSLPYRSVYGISKDGRPIYTPMSDNGKVVKDCDVDICNGAMLDGNYVYYSTIFHPFFMGCYGPGNSPKLYQRCSTKPRLCGVEYDKALAQGAMSLTKGVMAGAAAAGSLFLF